MVGIRDRVTKHRLNWDCTLYRVDTSEMVQVVLIPTGVTSVQGGQHDKSNCVFIFV